MKRTLIVWCILLSAGMAAAQTVLADKVTTDPNAPGASHPASLTDQANSDKRLAQKVTYQSGYARLHAVADDLTRKTGVTIYSGSNSKDWQVRDIPLVVCVKDLPLGRLLSAIADSTHTLISSTTLDSGVKVYRFYRNKRLQDSIDGALTAAQQKQYEQIDWAWDAMLKLGKSPEAQAEVAETIPEARRRMVSNARLLESLDADAKEKVISGETITIGATTSARKSALEDILLESWEDRNADRKTNGQKPLEMPKSEEIASAEATISLHAETETGNTEIYIVTQMKSGTVGGPCMCGLTVYASQLEKLKSLRLPPRPKGEQVADQESDRPADLKLRALETDQDWAQPPFAHRVKTEAPKDKKYLTFADAVTALGKASGLNIVTEDFLSHNLGNKGEYDGFCGSETTPSALLRKTLGSWFYNADDKLVVGWVWSHGLWRKTHRNLVSESFLLSLTAKLDTTGEDLDDVTPILTLTREQRNAWVYGNRDTVWLIRALWNDKPLWQLYDSLSADNKALAKSQDGLPLAALDPAGTAAFLRDKAAQEQAEALPLPQTTQANGGGIAGAASLESLLDLDALRTAVMRIRNVPATFPCSGDFGTTGKMVWGPPLHHSYVMEIEYEKDGQKATLRTSDLGLSLPVYSSKRETELVKKLGGTR